MIRKRCSWPCRDARGFTLVEVVVSVAILGVLSALAMKVYAENRTKSYDTQAINFMRNLLTAAETEAPTTFMTLSGEQQLPDYPQLQLNRGMKLTIQDSGDGENKLQFYLAHEGGKLGFYFWIPGPQCSVERDQFTTDSALNPVAADMIAPNMENQKEYNYLLFRTNAGL